MRVARGTVVSGKVILNDSSLPDGVEVYVLMREAGEQVPMSAEELAELEAGLAEADSGDTISGDEFFRQLGRHG